ncbi:MAG: type antifreeze protein [Proteobacteria bacterium]|nr:type antifreeze protein [Pseudomonadota bacterium]
MPIYEYRCGACGFQKEFLQRVSDAPLTDCPECGKHTLNKMVTAAGFQLKGSGWYATDFKDKGSAKPKPDAAKAADTAKKDESKAEAACGAGACPACN